MAIRPAPHWANKQIGNTWRLDHGWRHPVNARWLLLDIIFIGLIVALVVLTPLALGSVYPWPVALIEVAVGALIITWAIKIAAGVGERERATVFRYIGFIPPFALLAGLLVMQLIPLPPGVLRTLSPHTYEIYARTLPGWPQRALYSDQALMESSAQAGIRPESALLPTLPEVRRGERIPFAEKVLSSESNATGVPRRKKTGTSFELWSWGSAFPARWRPLAISPALTTTAVLRFAAYSGLFLVVLCYPFAGGGQGERRFYHTTLVAVLIAGVIVAAIGLAERVYWNGRILWLFVPMDWGKPIATSFPRATGPFVNPDHFANYLALILPLALAGSLFGLYSRSLRLAGAVRVLCGASALVILSAIVLSLSRAAWIEATASTVVLSLLWARDQWSKWKRSHQRGSWRDRLFSGPRSAAGKDKPTFAKRLSIGAVVGGGSAAFVAFVLTAWLIIGPQGRRQSDARLGITIMNGGGLGSRTSVWKDSLAMARDFPLFGVGLGGWPELFPHYQTGPWNEYYFREAHNDYLQYFAETGFAGLLALVWLLGLAARSVVAARGRLAPGTRPLLLALALAMATMAFHEAVDFCLHIPANALLCTLLLAIATRVWLTSNEGEAIAGVARPTLARAVAGGGIAFGAIFVVLAVTWRGLSYPYDVERASSASNAWKVLIEHPASAAAHMRLIDLAGERMTSAMRLRELATAVWLDPTDPAMRDRYAQTLNQLGQQKKSLDEVTESVFNSPLSGTHYYLDKRLIPWLLPTEQKAIERGFVKAAAAAYPGAVSGLGDFYDSLGDFSDEVKLFAQAARRASDGHKQADYFIDAANASIRAGDNRLPTEFFHRAIAAAPSRSEAYVQLIVRVCGRRKNMQAARSAAEEGIRNGADPSRLYMALAAAAREGGDEALAEEALLRAVQYSPSFGMIMRVAKFDLELNETERATSMLRNAVEINSTSAEAFYLLGVAEERDYQYWDADKAYARAAVLAPRQFQFAYSAFRRRMKKSANKG